MLLLLTCGPALVFHPTMAIESLPVSAGATASAELLPTKGPITPPPSKGDRKLLSDIQPLVPLDLPPPWLAPWQQGDEVIPAVFELPDPLAGTGTGPSPFLKLLAGEEEDGPVAAAPADEEAGPDDEAEEVPPGDATPEEGVGIGPPEESDEEWVPAEPADPGQDPVDPGAGGGEPRDLLPVEREVGNCVITGEVSDVTTLEPIAGASVVVLGQGREDITDAQGRFEIGGLPPGDYTVEALKLEYSMGEAAASPRPGSPAEIRISLRKKPAVDTADGEYLLAAESVVGEYREESGADLFLDLEVSPTIASGLSADDFAKASVGDAGEALSKITGANVVDGKYAVVRGLSDRYITTTFNNGAITSADPSRKTVQLDLLPTSVLKGLSIAKTYDVSLPGDFGGGTINIETLGMPEERFFKMNYELGWNSNLDEGDVFYRHYRRDLPYWGDVDTPVDQAIGFQEISDVGSVGEQDEVWDTLLVQPSWIGRRDKAKPSEKYGFTYGDRAGFYDDNVQVGVIAAFSHKTEDFLTKGIRRDVDPNNSVTYEEDNFVSSVDWSIFLSGFLEVGENHKLQYTHFHKRVTEDDLTLGRNVQNQNDEVNLGQQANPNVMLNGVGGNPGYGFRAWLNGEFWDSETIMRDLQLNQIVGEHKLGDTGPSFKWGFTKNNSFESRPNSSTLNYSVLDFADPRLGPDLVLQESADDLNEALGLGLSDPTWDEVAAIVRQDFPFLGSLVDTIENEALLVADQVDPSLGQIPSLGHIEFAGSNANGVVFSNMQRQKIDEDSQEFFADTSFPIIEGEDRSWRINAGFRGSNKKQASTAKVFLVDFNTVPDDVLYTPGGLGEQATNDPDLFTDLTTGDPNNGARILDVTDQEIRNYDGFSESFAAYIGSDVRWDGLQFSGGVRYEYEERGYFADPDLNAPGVGLLPPAPDPQNTWLPSLSLQQSLFDDRFRMGVFWSRTVARPTFFEFLPAETVDQATGLVRRGNPGLEDTSIENFDISFMVKLFENSSLVISPFHKNLEKPIIAQTNLDRRIITYDNGEGGNLQGVEFELNLAEWDHWTVRTNYTYINSTLDAFFDRDGSGPQAPVLVSQQYPGQPSHIFNFLLGYDNEETGWAANLIYNYTGDNLVYRRLSVDEPFILSPGFHQLDANISKSFEFKHCDLTLGLTVKNLLDTQTELIFVEGAQVYRDKAWDGRQPGRSFFFEISALF